MILKIQTTKQIFVIIIVILGMLENTGVSVATGGNEKTMDMDNNPLKSFAIQEKIYKEPTFHALVVGIDQFKDTKIKSLNCCRSDAMAVDTLFRNKTYIPFENTHITTLINGQATTDKVRSALKELANRSQPEDTVLVYFSSHGIQQDDNKAYWVLHDTRIDTATYNQRQLRILPETALGQGEISGLLSRLKAGKQVVFVDCCFSAATVISTLRNQAFTSPRIHNPFDGFKGKGRIFVTASKGAQPSVEIPSLGHGAFTYYLLKGLKGQADENGDNVVDLWEIWEFLDKKVTDIAKKHGNDQQPTISAFNLTHGFPLSTYPIVSGAHISASADNSPDNERSTNTTILWTNITTIDEKRLTISTMEISNQQYYAFLKANPSWRKDRIPQACHDGDYLKHWPTPDIYPEGLADHPVVYVSWYAAKAFAQWCDGRLPSQAEWESAISRRTLYPWGNQWRSDLCNNREVSHGNQEDSNVRTMPVNSFDHNGSLYNLAGNVWEWCNNWRCQYLSDSGTKTIMRKPVGKIEKVYLKRLIKGGSFNSDRLGCMVSSQLWCDPALCADDGGFRIVKNE